MSEFAIANTPPGSGSSIIAPASIADDLVGVVLESSGTPIAGNPHRTLNFTGASVADNGMGIATIDVSPSYFNVKVYGATGNGETDDSAAIRVAMFAASVAGGGVVYFPNGTYLISEFEASAACLTMPANVTLLGQSNEGAILKLKAFAGPSVRPILISENDCHVLSLTVDGNKTNQSTDEHRAAIFVNVASGTVLQDLILLNNTGDAIDLSFSNFTTIERCYCHDNNRNGITFNGNSNYVRVSACRLEGNANQFHMEGADEDDLCTFVWLEDTYCGPCLFDNVPVTIGNAQFCTVRNVEIMGGIQLAICSDILIEGCYIQAGDNAAGVCPVTIIAGASDVTFNNCWIHQTADQGVQNRAVVVEGSTAEGVKPVGISFLDCNIITDVADSNGVVLNSTGNITVSNCYIANTAIGNTGTGIASSAVDASQPPPTQGNVFVRGNHLYNWSRMIFAGWNQPTGVTMGPLMIDNNFLEGAGGEATAIGYKLSTSDTDGGGPSQCAMSGNDHVNLTTVWETYPDVPILTGGVRDGGGIYNCAGSPNGQITESVGAMAMQRDGAGGVVGWIKTSGASTNTGWQSINVT